MCCETSDAEEINSEKEEEKRAVEAEASDSSEILRNDKAERETSEDETHDEQLSNNRISNKSTLTKQALLFAVLFYFVIAVAAIIVRYFTLDRNILQADLLNFAPAWCLLGLLLGFFVVLISAVKIPVISKLEIELARLVQSTFGKIGWREVFALAFSSATAEELLFRGAVQANIGIVPAAIIFGLMHFRRNWWIFALVMGFVLGGLYELSGSLYPPMLLHFIVNFINLKRLSRLELPADVSESVFAD